MRLAHHRRRHHSRRHGDDGQAGDPCSRGIRPCRLSARRRGAADRRARRAAGRGRSPDRARRDDRQRMPRDDRARSRPRRRSGCCSGPAARRRSRRSAASRPTISAWTAPSRAPSCRRCWRAMREMSEKYGLRVANVFHAGDGNLHPLILYDANKPGELERAEQFGADILKLCVEVGGVLTGEHGVGVEKRDLMPVMFSEIDLATQQRVKCAFDDKGLLNPGKVFPVLHRCAELGRMHMSRRQAAVPGYSEVLNVLHELTDDRMTISNRATPRRSRTPCAGRSATTRRWNRRRRAEARDRPAEPDRSHARSLRAFRRHALRAGRTGALGPGRHAARRDRGAAREEQPAARLRADGLRPAARRAGRAAAPSAA